MFWEWELVADLSDGSQSAVLAHLGTIQKHRFSGPTPDLLSQKPCVVVGRLSNPQLNKPSSDSDACSRFRTTESRHEDQSTRKRKASQSKSSSPKQDC